MYTDEKASLVREVGSKASSPSVLAAESLRFSGMVLRVKAWSIRGDREEDADSCCAWRAKKDRDISRSN